MFLKLWNKLFSSDEKLRDHIPVKGNGYSEGEEYITAILMWWLLKRRGIITEDFSFLKFMNDDSSSVHVNQFLINGRDYKVYLLNNAPYFSCVDGLITDTSLDRKCLRFTAANHDPTAPSIDFIYRGSIFYDPYIHVDEFNNLCMLKDDLEAEFDNYLNGNIGDSEHVVVKGSKKDVRKKSKKKVEQKIPTTTMEEDFLRVLLED